jgi:hypothetical protein
VGFCHFLPMNAALVGHEQLDRATAALVMSAER